MFIFSRQNMLDTALEGVRVEFISLRDLISAKKSAKRLQDLADAEQLEKIYNRLSCM